MVELMRNSDAFTWAMEHDPGLRSTVVTIFELDRAPEWSAVLDRFQRIAGSLPMFRQRVVENLPPAPPRWEDDPDFDLAYHLRRVQVGGGGLDAVLEMARRAEMADFDRARPLWEVTLVEGLDGDVAGPAALLVKVHHALTDGVGGVEIAMILFDLDESPVSRGDLPEMPRPAPPVSLQTARQTARYDAGVLGSAARLAVRSGPQAMTSLALHPIRTTRSAAQTMASVYRIVRPLSRTGSALMTERSTGRRLGVHQVPVADLKVAAHAGGGTLNDAFLAGITGGMRLYHERHGVKLDDLHVCMPLNLRSDDDALGGNRITLMRFDVPAGEPDPRTRISRIHERAGRIRSEPSLPYTQLIAGALNLMPRWYIGSILKNVDVLASDVPGIPVHVWIGGARVTMQYPFGPTIGAAVNVTLMSYVDTCALGIDVDTAAIPDFEEFHACLVDGFAEVVGVRVPEQRAR